MDIQCSTLGLQEILQTREGVALVSNMAGFCTPAGDMQVGSWNSAPRARNQLFVFSQAEFRAHTASFGQTPQHYNQVEDYYQPEPPQMYQDPRPVRGLLPSAPAIQVSAYPRGREETQLVPYHRDNIRGRDSDSQVSSNSSKTKHEHRRETAPRRKAHVKKDKQETHYSHGVPRRSEYITREEEWEEYESEEEEVYFPSRRANSNY